MELNLQSEKSVSNSIPSDWSFSKVIDIASVKGGKRLPLGKSLIDAVTPHPYIRVTDMRPGGVSLSDIKYVPVDAFSAIKSYRIYSSDIFISVAGTLGIVGKVPESLSGANLTENADRITDISCSQDYLLHYLSSEIIQGVIAAEKTIGAQPKLALGRIQSFEIALPPTLDEQVAIATALSDVDDLLAKLDQLIAKKSDIKKGAMQELLTGKRRLPGFSGNWMRTTLQSAGECLRGVSYKGNQDLYQDENQLSRTLLRSNNIQDGRVVFSDVQFVKQERVSPRQIMTLGDILICMANGSKDLVGKAAYFDEESEKYTFGAFMGCFRTTCNAYSAKFIYFALQSDEFRKYVSNILAGSSINNLRPKDIESAEFLFPPIDEQSAIAKVLEDISLEITALEQKRNKFSAIKQAMMQQLLTGQIRLV